MRFGFTALFGAVVWAFGCGGVEERIENTCPIFPPDNWWNTDISGQPVDPMSDVYMASLGTDKTVHVGFGKTAGMPYAVVDDAIVKVPVDFEFAGISDPGPYPIPDNPPIQPEKNGHDRHVLLVHAEECRLYELFQVYPKEGGGWTAGSGAIWDLTKNQQRPPAQGSADAAGLSIFPALVKYAEIEAGEMRHAVRFAANKTQHAYVFPATNFAIGKPDPTLPPMGTRLRLKANVDVSGLPHGPRVMAEALKKYGMILADNGPAAPNYYIDGVPDERWDEGDNNKLKEIPMSDFEVVETGPITKGY